MFFPSPHPDIYCLLQSVHAAAGLAEGIAPAGLLSAEERARYEALRVPKRRRDWLLGRWTAKHLIRAYLAESDRPALKEIVILADGDGSPYAVIAGERLSFSLSISHSGAYAFCALTSQAGAAVGADVEMIEPRPLSLAEQFFTREELASVLALPGDERALASTLVWSAKEAFLKCIKEGLRVDTRAISVRMPAALSDIAKWQPLEAIADADVLPSSAAYQSWWRREGEMVLTLGILVRSRRLSAGR